MKILITGASGFIGSFLCEEGLSRGMETWAGVRENSSRRWLRDERLRFAVLDMAHPDTLDRQLEEYSSVIGRWDVIVHAGGATKCLHKEDFDRNNFDCTRNFVEALEAHGMLPTLFVYVSSLSVLGPIREQMVAPYDVAVPDYLGADANFVQRWTVRKSVYQPMTADDVARPNTAYGESKVKSEAWLREYAAKKNHDGSDAFRYVVIRPTGVYGPREKDYFMMAQSIKQHVDFAVGYKPQEITFIYVRDLVGAIYAAVGKAVGADGSALPTVICGKSYAVSDGFVYDSRAFSDLLKREMGVGGLLRIKAPLCVLRLICLVSEKLSKLTGKMTALNGDKYNIMSQRNWQCDIQPLKDDLGFVPEWNLERGVKEAVQWYKDNGWL